MVEKTAIPRKGRKPPLGDKRQFLTTMDPDIIRSIKLAALDEDRTASEIMEEAAKQRAGKAKNQEDVKYPTCL